jgi:hypothetical protein
MHQSRAICLRESCTFITNSEGLNGQTTTSPAPAAVIESTIEDVNYLQLILSNVKREVGAQALVRESMSTHLAHELVHAVEDLKVLQKTIA